MTLEELRKRTDAAFIGSDQEGRVTDVNAAFTAIFGWSREEIVGRPLTTIIPPNLRDAHLLGFSRFLTTNKTTLLNMPLSLKAISKEGRVFDAEHLIVAEKKKGRWSFGASIRPATNRPNPR